MGESMNARRGTSPMDWWPRSAGCWTKVCCRTQMHSERTDTAAWLSSCAAEGISTAQSSRRNSTCATMQSASCHGSVTRPACSGSKDSATKWKYKQRPSLCCRTQAQKKRVDYFRVSSATTLECGDQAIAIFTRTVSTWLKPGANEIDL